MRKDHSGRAARMALSALLFCLASGSAGAVDHGADDGAGAKIDGRLLYKRYCADCHRPLEHTNKPDRSARRLRSAIEHLPVMNHLSHLSEEQCEAITEVTKSRP